MSVIYKFTEEDFICPITQQVFYNPKIADDGHIYEKDAITNWLTGHNISPLTREIITNTLHPVSIKFKQLLDKFKNDNKNIEIYKPDNSYKLIKIVTDGNINDIIKQKIADTEITLNVNNTCNIYKFLGKHIVNLLKNDIIVNYCLDNNIFINVKNNGCKFIHLICWFSNYNVISKALTIYAENNYDLQCNDIYNNKPIHFICLRQSIENEINIKKILDIYVEKEYNIQCKNERDWQPIHILCRYSTPELISKILDIYTKNEYDLQCKNNDNWQPIHILCRYSTPDMIVKILDIYVKNNNESLLLCETNNGLRPINIICQYSTSRAIYKILEIYMENGYDLRYRNPIYFICKNASAEIIYRILNIYIIKKYDIDIKFKLVENIRANKNLDNYDINMVINKIGKSASERRKLYRHKNSFINRLCSKFAH